MMLNNNEDIAAALYYISDYVENMELRNVKTDNCL